MSFDSLGVNLTTSGIASTARQVGHLANSFMRYINVVERADAKSVQAARAQSYLADTMVNKAQKAVNSYQKEIARLESQLGKLTAAALRAAQAQVASAEATQGKAENSVVKLEQAIAKLTQRQENLAVKISTTSLRMRSQADIMAQYKGAVDATGDSANKIVSLQNEIVNLSNDILTTKSNIKGYSDIIAQLDVQYKALGEETSTTAKKIKAAMDAWGMAITGLTNKEAELQGTLTKKKELLSAEETLYAKSKHAVEAAKRALATYDSQVHTVTSSQKESAAIAARLTELQKQLAIAQLNVRNATAAVAQAEFDHQQALNGILPKNEQLEDVTKRLAQAKKNLAAAEGDLADATAISTQTTFELEETLEGTLQNMGLFPRLLSDLTGGFGKTTAANSSLIKGLSLTMPQLAAVAVAMDVVALAAKAVQLAWNLFMNILKTAWAILTKTVSMVYNLAKAVGTTLWNAFKKIISLPFNALNKMFGGLGGSMQRVLEMAIGMNTSRIWWQLGMRFRELAQSAADSAIEYQVTFTRLRSLMLNELMGQRGINSSNVEEYNKAMKEATALTEELVTWTSKLAVQTIFDSEAILNTYTLAMSYGFASQKARELTEATLDFATGMGLTDAEMKRVIENFGQLRAQGKITGTELRDLARGAFVPVNELLANMARLAKGGVFEAPNVSVINETLKEMYENGELTANAFRMASEQVAKLGTDGKITAEELAELNTILGDTKDLQKEFGLTAEEARIALEGIKTGKLTAELNELISTGKLSMDDFFDAFIDLVHNKFPNAARSLGGSMKAIKSNINDFINSMIGWRLLAPIFDVVAAHVQKFIESLMSDKSIASFDKFGKAFKVMTELLFAYGDTLWNVESATSRFFSTSGLSRMWRFANSLASLIGSFGTQEFEIKITPFKNMMERLLPSRVMSDLVTEGLVKLNSIMADILAGIEIDPKELGEAFNQSFGTLWREYFKPSLTKVWDDNIKPLIQRKISETWEKMRQSFSKWKTDKLIPGLKTFLTETIPGWFTSASEWISINGRQLVVDISKTVEEIVGAFGDSSSKNFGEDHWLTQLLRTLESLAGVATIKLEDPTKEWNSDKLAEVTEHLTNFASALGTAVINIPLFGDTITNYLGSAEFANTTYQLVVIAENTKSFFETLGSIINPTGKMGVLFTLIDKLSGSDTRSAFAAVAGLSDLVNLLATIALSLKTVVHADWMILSDVISIIAQIIKNLGDGDAMKAGIENVIKTGAFATQVSNMVDAWNDLGHKKDVDTAIGFIEKIRNFFGIVSDLGDIDETTDIKYQINFSAEVTAPTSDQIPPYYSWDKKNMKLVRGVFKGDERYVISTNIIQKLNQVFEYSHQDPPPGTVWNEETQQLEWVGTENWQVIQAGGYVLKKEIKFDIAVSGPARPGGASLPEGFDFSEMFDNFFKGVLDNNQSKNEVTLPMPTVKIDGDFSAVGEGQGAEFAKGIEDGIAKALTNVEVKLPEVDITNLEAAEVAAQEGGKKILASLSQEFSTGMATVNSTFATEIAKVPAEADGQAGAMSASGSSMISSLQTGMEGPMDNLLRWFQDQMDALIAKVPSITVRVNAKWNPNNDFGMGGQSDDDTGGDGDGGDNIPGSVPSDPALIMSAMENAANSLSGIASGFMSAANTAPNAEIPSGSFDTSTFTNTMGKGINDILMANKNREGGSVTINNITTSSTNNWDVKMSTPIESSTTLQAYEVLRMRARTA